MYGGLSDDDEAAEGLVEPLPLWRRRSSTWNGSDHEVSAELRRRGNGKGDKDDGENNTSKGEGRGRGGKGKDQ